MFTSTTTSLAAISKISTQETTPGHTASTAAFDLITVLKPSPSRERLSGASFSASPFGDAIIIDASHPYRDISGFNMSHWLPFCFNLLDSSYRVDKVNPVSAGGQYDKEFIVCSLDLPKMMYVDFGGGCLYVVAIIKGFLKILTADMWD
ncbi:hypothetical protein Vadar_018658 [Vaccinium darrowii]|uniref:Uncharacterized protein n=1 Tax=Vaccinium darrowii TaxID=229202 RepID=A0ACB7Y1G6_9ERIC|nr:hypothetical protein Vadar_018658 [Vaccinium darrowii]